MTWSIFQLKHSRSLLSSYYLATIVEGPFFHFDWKFICAVATKILKEKVIPLQ
jgi:hypothetical protein